MRNIPNIDHMRQFICVAEFGNFSKAAAALLVGQPSLTKRIQALEETLQVKLFHRHGRGVVLSAAGAVFLQFCRETIDRWEQLGIEIENAASSPRGELNFAVPAPLGAEFNSNILQYFMRTFPNVRLRIAEAASYHIQEWVGGGKIDLGLVYHYTRPNKPHEIEICRETLFLIGNRSENHSDLREITFEDAMRLPLVLPNRPSALREFIEGFTTRPADINVVAEVDSLSTTKELLMRGIGYSILPYSAVSKELEIGLLTCTPMTSQPIARWLMIILPAEREFTTTIKALIAVIKDQARLNLQTGRWRGDM